MKLWRLEKKTDGESMSGFLGLTGPVKFRYNKVNGNNIDGFPSFVLQCAASQQKIRRRRQLHSSEVVFHQVALVKDD